MVVAVLLAAGCTSQGPEPVASATSGPSATAKASPTPTPTPEPTPDVVVTSGPDQDVTVAPTPPAALDGPATADNAMLVGKYFIQLIPYVIATGETAQWDALSGPDCKFCASARELGLEVATEGQRVTGGAIDVGFGHASEAEEEGVFSASIDYVEHPSQRIAADGTVLKDYPEATTARAHLELRWAEGSWKILGASSDDLGSA